MTKEQLSISSKKEEKERKLQVIRGRVEQITDKLGKKIDEGIKETVTLFKAFDFS